ncbi:MAG TPA: DUF1194 domain-containing protein [Dongiaceae bacterium]|jgi:hypothetical protein
MELLVPKDFVQRERDPRSVINIIGNGADNVGEGPAAIRDLIVRQGGTINGVVLGADKEAVDYYRREVIGCANAFVLSIEQPDDVVDVLIRKLLGDVVVETPRGVLPASGRGQAVKHPPAVAGSGPCGAGGRPRSRGARCRCRSRPRWRRRR